MNFDRLRFVAERAEVGEQREAVFAVTIPEGAAASGGSAHASDRATSPSSTTGSPTPESPTSSSACRVAGPAGRPRRIAGPLERARASATLDLPTQRAGQAARAPPGRRPLAARARRAAVPVRVPRAAGRADAVPHLRCAPTGTSSCSTTATTAPTTAACWWACRCRRQEMPEFRRFLAKVGYRWIDESGNPAYRLFLADPGRKGGQAKSRK